MAVKCVSCGKKIGGFLGFGGVKESKKKGVCEGCHSDAQEKKKAKKIKRKSEKLKKAWLYGRR